MQIKRIINITCAMGFAVLFPSCTQTGNCGKNDVKFITVDPGHFHAALVQKKSYPGVNDTVFVYAPAGEDLNQHLAKINGYNSRSENPTSWTEVIYSENDFLEKMVSEKSGNVVVLAGNNRIKIDYIKKSLEAGINVFADKPMVINTDGFSKLEECFDIARKNGVLLYDIMTERNEITTILQKELAGIKEIYGTQTQGTPENPAITKESVHHFYKNVSGKALVRPAWFYNVDDQGEGIVDVTVHLVDLVQWECFPGVILNKEDVQISNARRWTTPVSREQFKMSTGMDEFPEFLSKDVKDDTLYVFSNGEINYSLKGVNAKIIVTWNFEPPVGGGDTHYSIMKGSKSNLIIKQGEEQNYIPELYIEPVDNNTSEEYKNAVVSCFAELEKNYPGIVLESSENGWHVIIPDKYRVGHEAHFGQVTDNFLQYLSDGKLPDWEVPNMITKYYTTTSALKIAKGN